MLITLRKKLRVKIIGKLCLILSNFSVFAFLTLYNIDYGFKSTLHDDYVSKHTTSNQVLK